MIKEFGGNDQDKLNKSVLFFFILLHDSTNLENIKTNLVYVSPLFVLDNFEGLKGA